MISRRLRRVVAVSVLLLFALAVLVAGLVATGVLQQPTVESIDNEWGTVTGDTTEIRTTVTVDNPNPVGIPGVVDVSYTARLNDVVLAIGSKKGVGFGTGTNELKLSTNMANSRIADWWVTHVNRDEQSQLSMTGSVSGPGFSKDIPASRSRLETDVLSGFEESEPRPVELDGEPFLVVHDESAEWGRANESVTPLEFTSTVENVHGHDVTLDGVEYVVEMNDVTLGEGQRRSGIDVAPGETGSLDVRMPLDTPKMADWWGNHVNDSERSTLTVEMYGLVERDGELEQIPIQLFDQSADLETDVLGSGGSRVAPRETNGSDRTFDRPDLLKTSRRWGAVEDDTTEILTTVRVDNTNDDEAMNDFLAVDVAQQTTINDVLVSAGEQRHADFEHGTNEFELTALKNNSKVPEWWARHINDGESSTVVTTPTATADLAFTRFDLDVDESTSAFETDVLAGMRGDESETVAVNGEPALVVTRDAVEWGHATPEVAPIDVEATLENQQRRPVDVTEIRYEVVSNDVVLADRTVPETWTVPANAAESTAFTMELDNGKMDEWWVTHVRRDESSVMNISVHATVETVNGTETVPLDSLGGNSTIETDVLGQDDESSDSGDEESTDSVDDRTQFTGEPSESSFPPASAESSFALTPATGRRVHSHPGLESADESRIGAVTLGEG